MAAHPFPIPHAGHPSAHGQAQRETLGGCLPHGEVVTIDAGVHEGSCHFAGFAIGRVLAVADGGVRIQLADAPLLLPERLATVLQQEVDPAERETRDRLTAATHAWRTLG